MTSPPPAKDDHSWLTANSTNSQDIAAYYDDWAEDYDETLAQWDYQSPTIVANLLKEAIPLEGKILDAGCGTGLTGRALRRAGFKHLTGIDISQDSLDVAAQAGIYERLLRVNMQQPPLPFEAGEFAGVQCVGVLTYIPDTDAIMREFCRVVRPGGLVVFTQRDDISAERDYLTALQVIEDDGLWQKVSISEPQLYLPGNEDFSDKIKVIYYVFRVK